MEAVWKGRVNIIVPQGIVWIVAAQMLQVYLGCIVPVMQILNPSGGIGHQMGMAINGKKASKSAKAPYFRLILFININVMLITMVRPPRMVYLAVNRAEN